MASNFFNGYKDDREAAQKANLEYSDSVRDLSHSYQDLSDDWGKPLNVDDESNELSNLQTQRDLNQLKESNELNKSSSRMGEVLSRGSVNDNYIENKAEVRKAVSSRILKQKQERDQTIIAARQLASDEASMKYQLAQQTYDEKIATRNNLLKSLGSLGLSVAKIFV